MRELSRPLPAARPRKVFLQNLAGLFVRDLLHCFRPGRFVEIVHPPNIDPALHIHPKAPEAYYVLEGSYHIKCGKKSYHVRKGDFVFVPKGIPHRYQSGPNEEKC